MITNTGLNEVKEIMDYLDKTPYCVTRKALYNANELYEGFKIDDEDSYGNCFDGKVYQYYQFTGMQETSVYESLARSLHDHGIHAALREFMGEYDPQRWVGVMGGHALPRTVEMYPEIAALSKKLTEKGFIMLSGGGPGAMEATHLGAWMAGRTSEELDEAIAMLTPTPSFKDKGWLCSAFRVMKKFPQERYVSLGIPTWLYGHEPSTPFATHIAKFFDNSVRGQHPHAGLWRTGLYAWQRGYHAGNLPGSGSEPLSLLWVCKPDDIPGQGILEHRDACLSPAGTIDENR